MSVAKRRYFDPSEFGESPEQDALAVYEKRLLDLEERVRVLEETRTAESSQVIARSTFPTNVPVPRVLVEAFFTSSLVGTIQFPVRLRSLHFDEGVASGNQISLRLRLTIMLENEPVVAGSGPSGFELPEPMTLLPGMTYRIDYVNNQGSALWVSGWFRGDALR